jgi:hypothetical protein
MRRQAASAPGTRSLHQNNDERGKTMRRFAWLKTLRTGYAFCVGILLGSAAPALKLCVSDFNNDQVLR